MYIEELAKTLCEASGCHHKCHDTTDCVVEDEAKELFKQALVEGVNRHIDKTIEGAKQIEEMARFMCSNYAGEGNCGDGNKCDFDCWSYREAKHLHELGY